MALYPFFNFISGIALLIYNLLQHKKKKLLVSKLSYCAVTHFRSTQTKVLSGIGFWVILEIVFISVVQTFPGMFIHDVFGDLLNTGANYFATIFFGPLMIVAFCFIVKIDPLEQLDLITPAYPLALIFIKIACYFGGCCRGIEWAQGFYNPVSRLIEFPIQLLESGVALLLFVFLLVCRNKLKKGAMFPLYVISYSLLRFFTEFLRVEPEVFIGLKTYQILCIVGVVIGVIEYFLICKYNLMFERIKV